MQPGDRGGSAGEGDTSLLDLLLEAGQIGSWDWDIPSGHVIFGGRWASMLGYTADELEPRFDAWARLLHPDEQASVAQVLTDHLEGRTPYYELEHRLRHKDGSWRWILTRGQVIARDAAGKPARAVGTHTDVTELHAQRERLREGESRLRIALEAARAGTFDLDLVGRSAPIVTAEAKRLFGFRDDEDPSFDAFLDRVDPADRDRVTEVLDASRDTGAGHRIEYRVRHPDGRTVWLASRAEALRDPSGRVHRLIGVVMDVTDRKAGEEALRDSESFYRQALESIPGMSFTNRPDGSCDYVSEQWVAFTGVPAPAHLGDGWVQVLHPEDRPRAFAAWRDAVAGRGQFDLEYRVRNRAGHYEWFKTRGRALRDASGTIVRWIGTAVNVDDLKRVEAQLRGTASALSDSERRMRQVIDSMFAFVAVVAPDGTLLEANRAPLEAAGLERADVVGRPFWDCWWWTHDEAVRARVRAGCARAAAGELVRYEETIRVAGDGRMVIDFMLQPVFEDGRPKFVIFSAVDVTARFEAERKLLEADRRKDAFLATLSHELRNPLAPIRNAAQVLSRPDLSPEQLHWAQGVIQRQVGQMALLLDDLLDIARITQDKLRLRRERVSLAAVAQDAIEAARPQLDARGHRLVIALPPSPPTLFADRLRASQVLANLLTNAAKYTPPGGRIRVTARVDGAMAVLSVQDDGVGIPPEALDRIFTMFAQVEGGGQTAGGGLGIGLALVKGLVELHGGDVEARSEGLGRGSEFVVRLPLAEGAAPASVGASEVAAPVGPVPRRVLVADDNADAATSLALLLELGGHEVRVAHDGRSALDLARAFRPEVALLDIGMPELDGYGVARALREEAWGASVRLVALTGWGQEDDKRRASDAGFDHHLTKPVDPAAVEALVGAGPR